VHLHEAQVKLRRREIRRDRGGECDAGLLESQEVYGSLNPPDMVTVSVK